MDGRRTRLGNEKLEYVVADPIKASYFDQFPHDD